MKLHTHSVDPSPPPSQGKLFRGHRLVTNSSWNASAALSNPLDDTMTTSRIATAIEIETETCPFYVYGMRAGTLQGKSRQHRERIPLLGTTMMAVLARGGIIITVKKGIMVFGKRYSVACDVLTRYSVGLLESFCAQSRLHAYFITTFYRRENDRRGVQPSAAQPFSRFLTV